jgi:hypothetical protein
MISMKRLLGALVLLGMMLLGFQGSAYAADADKCAAITAIPTTIIAPGSYCLTGNITTQAAFTFGTAITVSADNVTIDLSGYTLSNLPAGTATNAIGIQAIGHNNVTVMNGTVRGFWIGIQLTGASGTGTNSTGHLVTNVRADLNRMISIQVIGLGSVVRQNQIIHTGGSTLGGVSINVGIQIGGEGTQAIDNSVVDTVPSPSANTSFAILVDAQNVFGGAIVEGNRVVNFGTPAQFAVGIDIGLSSFHALVVNNRIANFGVGVLCTTIIDGEEYRDNITINTINPYIGGTALGTNNY